jgi:hypothetical protein
MNAWSTRSLTVARAAVAAAAIAAATLCAAGVLAPPAGAIQPPFVPISTVESATIADCHSAPVQSERFVTFAAQMTATHRTQQMWVRFDLLERLPGDAGFRSATAPSLGVWQKSMPGIELFRFSQAVVSLPAPGTFRASVSFRWYGPRHHLIRHTHHVTAACAVPDERSHLTIGPITRGPGPQPDSTQYDVPVRNEGLGAAQNIGVVLTIDGAAQPQQTIALLAPNASQTLTFVGPRWGPGGSLTVTVDPAGSVGQTTRADDTRTDACA